MTRNCRIARFGAWAIAIAAAAGTGCGKGAGGTPPVVVSPASVTLEPGASQRFTASGGGRAGFGWSLGTGAEGTLDADGTYHAPALSPPAPVRVRATSIEDPRVWAEAEVRFPERTVTVSPASVDVVLGTETSFSAAVGGASDRTVTWSTGLGTISAAGVYRAPSGGIYSTLTETVRALSNATGVEGTANVRFRVAPPVLTAVSGPATAGETITLTGSGLSPPGVMAQATVYFTSAWGGTIAVTPKLSVAGLTVEVPAGASSGPVTVTLDGGPLGAATSNPAPFVRLPRLRLHAARDVLASGESTRLDVALLGAPGPVDLSFQVDAGSVVGNVYTAPAVTGTTYVNVKACVAATSNCSGSTLAIHPFRVAPSPALVGSGATLALEARSASGTVPATFSLVAGGGTLASDGTYVAPAAIADAGQAWAMASAGSSAALQIGVVGSIPGLLHRVVDAVDHLRVDPDVGAPLGSYAEVVAVGGGRAYVSASVPVALYASRTYHWIDVYDLADPIRPVWLGAVESTTRPDGLFVAGGHLYAWSERDWSLGFAKTLAVYDLSGPLPLVEAERVIPEGMDVLHPWAPPVDDGVRLFTFGEPTTDPAIPVEIRALADGGLGPSRRALLPLPPGTDPDRVEGVTAARDRAWATWFDAANARWLGAWDLSVDPPAFLGAADGGGYSLRLSGDLLVVDGATVVSFFDARQDPPQFAGAAPFGGSVAASAGTRAVVRGYQNGYHVLDLTDPSAPRRVATLYAGQSVNQSAALGGGLLYAAEGLGGLSIYDVAHPGGALDAGRLASSWAYAMGASAGRLYAAGAELGGGAALRVFDLAAVPAALVATLALPDTGSALDVAGDRLLIGTAIDLETWSIASSGAPSRLGTMPIDVAAARLAGTVAWVGTFSGDLVSVDLADPSTPAELMRLPVGGTVNAIEPITAGLLAVAYASTTMGGIVVVDVADPAAPVEVARADLGVPVYSLARDGGTLLAATAAGLVTVDVSDPRSPVPLVLTRIPGPDPFGDTWQTAPAWVVAVHGGIAWVGTGYANGALHGFDVRNPRWPREVTRVALGTTLYEHVFALAFDGTRGFAGVAANPGALGGGIAELDVTQPRNVVMTLGADPALQH